jgi:inositol transport system substrate-binding protein
VQPIVDIPFQLITKENYEKFTSKNQK